MEKEKEKWQERMGERNGSSDSCNHQIEQSIAKKIVNSVKIVSKRNRMQAIDTGKSLTKFSDFRDQHPSSGFMNWPSQPGQDMGGSK